MESNSSDSAKASGDVVERLEEVHRYLNVPALDDAITEIERLRAENKDTKNEMRSEHLEHLAEVAQVKRLEEEIQLICDMARGLVLRLRLHPDLSRSFAEQADRLIAVLREYPESTEDSAKGDSND